MLVPQNRDNVENNSLYGQGYWRDFYYWSFNFEQIGFSSHGDFNAQSYHNNSGYGEISFLKSQ